MTIKMDMNQQLLNYKLSDLVIKLLAFKNVRIVYFWMPVTKNNSDPANRKQWQNHADIESTEKSDDHNFQEIVN